MASRLAVGALIEQVADQFADADLYFGHGTDNPWDEAVALVLGVTGYVDDQRSLTLAVNSQQRDVIELCMRLRITQRIPLPYLLGECRFAGYRFAVSPDVIVPRSPIAELIQAGFQPWLTTPPKRVLDLCCGGGCIGIATALEFPDARVTLVDIDPNATRLAQENVARYGLGGRVTVQRGDLFATVSVAKAFDLIICNPPYVDAADMETLPAEYRHEPELALAAGVDGLDLVRRVLQDAGTHLAQHGLLVVEVGHSAPALNAAYPSLPFVWPSFAYGGEGVFLLEGGALASHTAPS